ncbi:hypothetical protein EV714DRAFT_183989, partial [Schizophyllum commune]
EELTALALDHFNANKGMLRIGHGERPESLYNNPLLYPKMFPWLFPFGRGGLGCTSDASSQRLRLSLKEHCRHLLMYYDKRFQLDPAFIFVAFSHFQIRDATTQSFLVARRSQFEEVSQRILSVDPTILQHIIN